MSRVPGIVGPFVAMELPSAIGDSKLIDEVLLQILDVALEHEVGEAGCYAKENLFAAIEKLHRVAVSLRCAIEASAEQNGEVTP